MSEEQPSASGEQGEPETGRQSTDNKGTARAWGSEPPAKEPEHPGQEETFRPTPGGVGSGRGRRRA